MNTPTPTTLPGPLGHPSAQIVTGRGTLSLRTAKDGTPVIDSRTIAWECGIGHRSAYRMLLKFQEEIEAEIGLLRFEIAKPLPSSVGGRPQTFCLLDEVQATALITLFRNTVPVVRFKIRLAKAFGFLRNEAPKPTSRTCARYGQSNISGQFQTKYPLDDLLMVMGDHTWRTSQLQKEARYAIGISRATFYRKFNTLRQTGRLLPIFARRGTFRLRQEEASR